MFYFEVPSDNKLVDLVKQIKRGEMDIRLGLYQFSYLSISLSFHNDFPVFDALMLNFPSLLKLFSLNI